MTSRRGQGAKGATHVPWGEITGPCPNSTSPTLSSCHACAGYSHGSPSQSIKTGQTRDALLPHPSTGVLCLGNSRGSKGSKGSKGKRNDEWVGAPTAALPITSTATAGQVGMPSEMTAIRIQCRDCSIMFLIVCLPSCPKSRSFPCSGVACNGVIFNPFALTGPPDPPQESHIGPRVLSYKPLRYNPNISISQASEPARGLFSSVCLTCQRAK